MLFPLVLKVLFFARVRLKWMQFDTRVEDFLQGEIATLNISQSEYLFVGGHTLNWVPSLSGRMFEAYHHYWLGPAIAIRSGL